jgi:hypothetical protein
MIADSRRKGPGAIELLEQSVAVLRRAPATIPATYYLGSLPFILGLLYFWTDMARSPFAQKHLAVAAAGMTLLYVWMKTWHAIFSNRLTAHLAGDRLPEFSAGRIARIVAQQSAWQPFGLFLLPAALVVMLPFGWVFAYFHSLTVAGNGEQRGFKEVSKQAWAMASLWTGQNHILIGFCWILWMVVFINVASLFAFLPEALRMLTGIESAFTMSGMSLLNTTFFAIVAAFTHLIMNPVIKTIYVLRCFYGESLQSGADLKAELNAAARESSASRVAILVLAVFCVAGLTPARAAGAETRVSSQELNESIDRVINKREYQWRVPRAKQDVNEDRGVIVEFIEGVKDWVERRITKPLWELWKRLRNWLRRIFLKDSGGDLTGSPALTEEQLTLLLVLLAAAAIVLGIFLWRVWRRKKEAPVIAAQPVAVLPDLKDENIVASQLPEEEWQALAAELMMKGELRLAMRALYMASLAFLAGRGLITIARYKSNRDYQRELLRRAREKKMLLDAFSDNVSLFERSWYGAHEVTPQLMETFDINHDRIRTFGQE